MIDLLRLDERLIHGQIATGWVKALPIDTLLVVDDESANDAFLTKTLYMAAPSNIKTFVMTKDDALNVLNDPRCENRHVFVVVRTIETLLEIARSAKNVQAINISNYGRMVTKTEERKPYTDHLFLSIQEMKKLQEVTELKVPVFVQMTPTSAKKSLIDVLKDGK